MPEIDVSLPLIMAGIYLHIPFCKQACHYCDFHFSTKTEIKDDLLKMMGEEILLQKDYLAGEAIHTLYFGGGTPSLLRADELAALLATVRDNHPLSADAEITLEANPDDLTREKLRDFKSIGINRLSIGIQSFDDAILKYLNRAHDARTAFESVTAAREAGFHNISIDLIYAIPGLTNEAWQENLSRVLALNPPHISAYSLTIEEKTTFGKWQRKGKLKPIDETLAGDQFSLLMDTLAGAGYRHYEISNFSRPGSESRHNSSYWKGEKYLGIGPGAHSYNLESRQYNISNNHLYVRALAQGTIPCETEVLTKNDHINEYLFTTLRTDHGCDTDLLKDRFGYDIMRLHGEYIRRLESRHLVTLSSGRLLLTPNGRMLADKISSDLFLTE